MIRFINRYHRTPGFEHVVRDYGGGRYKRAVALLAMRLADRLAGRRPDPARRIRFERTVGLAPGGHPVQTIGVEAGGLRYRLEPSPRIDPLATRGRFLRDAALLGSPDAVRWVFDGRRLGMRKREIVDRVRRILSGGPGAGAGPSDRQRWLGALDRIVLVV